MHDVRKSKRYKEDIGLGARRVPGMRPLSKVSFTYQVVTLTCVSSFKRCFVTLVVLLARIQNFTAGGGASGHPDRSHHDPNRLSAPRASAQLRMMGTRVGGKVGDLRPSASVCLHWFGPEHVSSQRVQEQAAERADGSDGACMNGISRLGERRTTSSCHVCGREVYSSSALPQ